MSGRNRLGRTFLFFLIETVCAFLCKCFRLLQRGGLRSFQCQGDAVNRFFRFGVLWLFGRQHYSHRLRSKSETEDLRAFQLPKFVRLQIKSKFQEEAQERVSITPNYKVMKETGPDHDKYFNVGIFFGDKKIAEGKGKSKQEAQTAAAVAALTLKGWE